MRVAVVLTAAAVAFPGLTAQAAVSEVDTRDELVAVLAGATAGDTVTVAGSASIDLTGLKSVRIPPGVTLASDRGQNGSPGALLYNTELDLGQAETWHQFRPEGAGVRITGLRLRGPDTEIRDDTYGYDLARAIEAVDTSDLLVDNNELWGWSYAAVTLRDSMETLVTGNDIHHNRRTGLGYGVVLFRNASAVIERNTFSQNRHAIAGNGWRTQRYDARFNLVVDNARSHGFDMHGVNEVYDNGEPWAGDVMHINNNSFRSAAESAVVVRGRPQTGAWISRNCIAGTAAQSVRQQNFLGNFTVSGNTYGTTTGNCHVVGTRRPVAWQLSDGGTGAWQDIAPYTYEVSEVDFGDFDADGRTDVFRATGSRWYYSPGGTGDWVPLSASTTTREALRLGDFDGDGRTDVFATAAGQWRYSSGGNSAWAPLNTSSAPLSELSFGDFDGDGRTDVFRSNGTQWSVVPGARGPWQPLRTVSVPRSELAFGDFDGDGRTDVFALVGERWQFSPGGSGAWQPLSSSNFAAPALKFGDLDGDGRTDVFRPTASEWLVAYGGRGSWTPLRTATCPPSDLALADLTGDGRADVFTGRCGG